MTQIGLFLAALIAVLLLGRAARGLDLGGDPRIRDTDHARELAREACYGFEAVDVALDRAGYGALLRDAAGRVMLLRCHGARFAARLLDRSTTARLDRHFLSITAGDRFFGTVTLNLGREAQVWAGSFRRLGTSA